MKTHQPRVQKPDIQTTNIHGPLQATKPLPPTKAAPMQRGTLFPQPKTNKWFLVLKKSCIMKIFAAPNLGQNDFLGFLQSGISTLLHPMVFGFSGKNLRHRTTKSCLFFAKLRTSNEFGQQMATVRVASCQQSRT